MGFGWKPYVPVAQRRRNSEQAMGRMRRSGVEVQPVRIEGTLIASTFWGKAWCRHLESFSDFENRLPRGRTYVRNGSVCHLEILRGRVNAKVHGSAMYSVAVDIRPLPRPAWTSIKERCTGRIASLLDLLEGRLSSGVMKVVTDRTAGLFPSSREIRMECSCPDWATMCKHVAAVLYGVGARLDEQPELLFLLRGVDHEELIDARAEAAVQAVVSGGKGRRIAEKDLGAIFGVEIDSSGPPIKTPSRSAPLRSRPRGKASPRAKDGPTPQGVPPFPTAPTGSDVRELRERLLLTRGEFSQLLSVSEAAVSLWERSFGALRLQTRTRAALKRAWAGHSARAGYRRAPR
jgi:uncharacterized Zn finger protein